jgi:hypothetical protein
VDSHKFEKQWPKTEAFTDRKRRQFLRQARRQKLDEDEIGRLSDRHFFPPAARWIGLTLLVIVGLAGILLYASFDRNRPAIPVFHSENTASPPIRPEPSAPPQRSNELPELTPERQRSLVNAFQALKSILPTVVVTTNGYSNGGYANTIAELFGRAGIEPSRGIETSNGPDETGIMIAAKDPNNLPEAAKQILNIFSANGLNPKVIRLPSKVDTEFTVFIGPTPL